MVDRRRDADELREEFSVLGSTGNVRISDAIPPTGSADTLVRRRYIR
jgi:hypothetical protein